MALPDFGDITQVDTFIGFTDDGEIGEILRCSALTLTADFTGTVLFADQTGR